MKPSKKLESAQKQFIRTNNSRSTVQNKGYSSSLNEKTQYNRKQSAPSPTSDHIYLNKKIVSPQKLKILVLSGNKLENDDLQFLSRCINLIKLDLSHNQITKLYERFEIRYIKHLRVFNIESNRLSGIDSIQSIFGLPKLCQINYRDNPIEQNPKLQHILVNNLMNLKVINNRIVFIEERDPNLIVNRPTKYLSNVFQQWKPAEHTQSYYLRVLKLQMDYVDYMWMFQNPIIKIQRVWIGILDELNFSAKAQEQQQKKSQMHTVDEGSVGGIVNFLNDRYHTAGSKQPHDQQYTRAQIIQSVFFAWKKYSSSLKSIKEQLRCEKYYEGEQPISNSSLKSSEQNPNKSIVAFKNKEYMTLNIHEYFLAKRNLEIKDNLSAFLKKVRETLYTRKMARLFRANINLKALSFKDPVTSYMSLSGLRDTRKLYFSRSQQHIVQNFLSHISKNFNKHSQIYNLSKFAISNKYISIRLMDPDTYSAKKNYNAFTYLMWPCMKAVILKKKKFQFKTRNSIIKIKPVGYIKNRDMKLTPQEYKKSVQIYRRIDKFFKNEYYDSLGYFQCPDDFVLEHLIRMIYYHNTKTLEFEKIIERSELMSLLQNYSEPISVYTEKLLQRTTSAVKIQQQWRTFIANKRQREGVYQILKKNRAARLIQRFFRTRVFYHRISFQKSLSFQLDDFNTNEILFHKNLYMNLQQTLASNSTQELYKGLLITYGSKIRIYHEYFPQKQVFFPTLRKKHFDPKNSSFGTTSSFHLQRLDALMILHKHAKVNIIEFGGQTFYQFIYSNKYDVKIRTACIALLSYRMFGSSYILPLNKNILIKRYNQRIKTYSIYGITCSPIRQEYFKQFELEGDVQKFSCNVKQSISQEPESGFMFVDEKYEVLFKPYNYQVSTLNVQFYQKRFQNFPQKYMNTLHVLHLIDSPKKGQTPNNQTQKKPPEVLDVENIIITQNELLSLNKQIKRQSFEVNKKDEENAIIKNKTSLNFISSTVPLNTKAAFTSGQRRRSLYALDGGTVKSKIEAELNLQNKTQEIRQMSVQQNEARRQMILTKQNEAKQKQSFYKDKRQTDLSKLREKARKQKMLNMTLKNLKQTERMQQVKKKTDRIKSLKKDRSSSKNQTADESQFIQQGNFIMEQQLKIKMMRTNMRNHQKIRENRRKSYSQTKYPNYNIVSEQSDGQKSFRSTLSKDSKDHHSYIPHKKFMIEGDEYEAFEIGKSVNSKQKNHLIGQQGFFIEEKAATGERNNLLKSRPYTKKRSSKTGAYLRDPSFVHGVFPEEYYPIQNSRGGIVFPKVG